MSASTCKYSSDAYVLRRCGFTDLELPADGFAPRWFTTHSDPDLANDQTASGFHNYLDEFRESTRSVSE